jgi:class 3 adenylate cyclase
LTRPVFAAILVFVAEVEFAESGDVNIAYRAVGDGPIDLVYVQGAFTHLDVNWEQPVYRRYCDRLAEFSRLILFDKRGMGMSDRVPGAVPLEVRMDDIRAVLDAIGSESAAVIVELPGEDHVPWFRPDATLAEIREFLTGSREPEEPDRVLATVLFTDIVGSTELATQLGDRRWRDVLETHHTTVRAELSRYRGREVDTAGDGFLAVFDGPARAIRAARSIVDAVRRLGLEVRAGVHTGEVEQLPHGDIRGIAVHIGARVMAAAGPGDVLVSSSVRDLVAGSGFTFVDRGVHALKGVAEERRLYAVAS